MNTIVISNVHNDKAQVFWRLKTQITGLNDFETENVQILHNKNKISDNKSPMGLWLLHFLPLSLKVFTTVVVLVVVAVVGLLGLASS